MTNIWTFLNQTLSVSLVAAILFLVKQLLNDKLSPRWQYGICSILALRILIPVQIGKGIFMPIQVWLEVWKANVEKGMDSVYTEIYLPAKVNHIFPQITMMPKSITDWLFVGYIAGVIGMLLWYLISYYRLRTFLKKGREASKEQQEIINRTAIKYDLKLCKVVIVDGITTAFVCAGIRPILALPAKKEMEEKILLHELLHLKYHDEWQSVGWCILRSFHWCNPFLQYMFNRIENDMESLCDQRVLERLDGEERREYGLILLEMANEKYARVPGTSSISNGGKNISRRIEAIVRFKKYPKGMALVSICIAVILFVPGLMEVVDASGYQYQMDDYEPRNEVAFEKAMALARLNRCTTIEGALDAYAKGLISGQGIYLATVSPLSEQEEWVRKMCSSEKEIALPYKVDTGIEFDTLTGEEYGIFNIEKIGEERYKAYLVLSSYGWYDSHDHSVIVPVEVWYEDGWVVKECGERILSEDSAFSIMYGGLEGMELATYEAIGETGAVTIRLNNYYEFERVAGSTMWVSSYLDGSIKPNAKFASGTVFDNARYVYTEDANENNPEHSIGIKYMPVDSLDEDVEFPDDIVLGGTGGGSDSNGVGWASQTVDESGSNILRTGGGRGQEPDAYENSLPEGFRVEIYWDNELVETLHAVRVETTNTDSLIELAVKESISQTTVYMDCNEKIAFKKEKDRIAKPGKTISDAELDEMLEHYMFSENLVYEEQEEIRKELNEHGIYPFVVISTEKLNFYMPYTKVLRPQIFYNANDGSWIVTCGGYYNIDKGDLTNKILSGDVGEKEYFGVRFTETTGNYDSYVLRSVANLTDQEQKEKTETTSRADGDGSFGFSFELQDYVYYTTNYVGYRWYGACTYAAGFENFGGNVTAIYEHTR